MRRRILTLYFSQANKNRRERERKKIRIENRAFGVNLSPENDVFPAVGRREREKE